MNELITTLSLRSSAGVAALAYRLLFSGEIDSSTIINGSHSVLGKIGFETPEFLLNAATLRNSGWCPLDSKVGSGVPRHLLLVAIGHFCCCMGDTLASEVSPRQENACVSFTFKNIFG